MNHNRIFKITYLPVTNTKPTRIKICDQRFLKTKIINSSGHDTREQMENFFKNLGIEINCFAFDESSKDYYFLSSNFEIQIK
jgi:hypothetical protein